MEQAVAVQSIPDLVAFTARVNPVQDHIEFLVVYRAVIPPT